MSNKLTQTGFFHRRFVFAPVCRGVTSKRSSSPTAVNHPDILNRNNPTHFPLTRVHQHQQDQQQDPNLVNYLKFLLEQESQDFTNVAGEEFR